MAIAVCPMLYGHVKDKAQNWESETDEICVGKLSYYTIWFKKYEIGIVVMFSVHVS